MLQFINEICKEYNIHPDFEIVIHAMDNKPIIELSSEIITFVASVNGEIGFDLYRYNEEELKK